jgi:protein-arginine kinase activator protein McsA
LVHVFDQTPVQPDATCELCKEQPAAFHWTERRDGKIPETHDILVCRICAGMILLIGEDH